MNGFFVGVSSLLLLLFVSYSFSVDARSKLACSPICFCHNTIQLLQFIMIITFWSELSKFQWYSCTRYSINPGYKVTVGARQARSEAYRPTNPPGVKIHFYTCFILFTSPSINSFNVFDDDKLCKPHTHTLSRTIRARRKIENSLFFLSHWKDVIYCWKFSDFTSYTFLLLFAGIVTSFVLCASQACVQRSLGRFWGKILFSIRELLQWRVNL